MVLGIATVQALLMRGPVRSAVRRGPPQIRPRPNVGQPPPAGNQLRVTRPTQIAGGALGETTAFGEIVISRNQSMSEQRLTLLHELVHRFFSSRTGPLRRLRAELSMSAYSRSALLRYLEEALAEGYAQLRINGFVQAISALRFPLQHGYVTVSDLVLKGQLIGTITVGGTLLRVTLTVDGGS